MLERDAYELLGRIIIGRQEPLWLHREQLLSGRGRYVEDNPFSRGMRALFAKDQKAIDRRVRSRIATRLKHAHDHFIPAPFLNGFLGPIGRVPVKDTVEPGYEIWLAYMIRFALPNAIGARHLLAKNSILPDLMTLDALPQLRLLVERAGAEPTLSPSANRNPSQRSRRDVRVRPKLSG